MLRRRCFPAFVSRSISLKQSSRSLTSTVSETLTCPPKSPTVVTPSVRQLIQRHISAAGPITVSTYMRYCQIHPDKGYYKRSQPIFGTEGDFVTSPDISQVFGETLAAFLYSQFVASGCAGMRLIELGPGKGTLSLVVQKTLQKMMREKNAFGGLFLVENSSHLQAEQAGLLPGATWVSSIEDIPPAKESEFTGIIANEFFDALPIHIFQWTSIQNTQSQGWREILVASESENSPFRFIISPIASPGLYHIPAHLGFEPKLGDRVEVSPDSVDIAGQISSKISPKGAGLIIDYGSSSRTGSGTFRAFHKHQIVDTLADPGEHDLTANVDFLSLSEAVSEGGSEVLGLMDQSMFLERMGAAQRAEQLGDGEVQNVKKLMDVDGAGQGMGVKFKVLGLVHGIEAGNVYPFV